MDDLLTGRLINLQEELNDILNRHSDYKTNYLNEDFKLRVLLGKAILYLAEAVHENTNTTIHME